MNRSEIFSTAHQTAKATRNNFASYRAAFAVALKAAYAPKVELSLIDEYGHKQRVEKAIAAIADGGKWNGIVYAKKVRSGKRLNCTVYVDGNEIYIGDPLAEDTASYKAEFMAAVRSNPIKNQSAKQDNRSIFGTSSEGENDLQYRPTALYHAEMSI